ncbi:fungal-specific transcription factor domain-containing protein [Mucor mucedo]|uniref:fungal-specific transcription factor domain-containing protein n=1 Tax=Mucor mucedo TaxID=29922 RepID=UPI00221EDD62|nr:fungal-specific transcription factor domain-containing protein [Mucor mucedo]KAI7894704.1 fungal-specific transcription factor domain-containing protein [Mucor mucedo]
MEPVSLSSSRNKTLGTSKRIKISRACDECRKRKYVSLNSEVKVKCDGVQPCGRCKKSNAECVFAKLPPKRGPPKQYMESLENRLQRVEKALKSVTVHKKLFEEEGRGRRSVSFPIVIAPNTIEQRFTINEIGQAVYAATTTTTTSADENNKCRITMENITHLNNDTQSDISDSPISSSNASFFPPIKHVEIAIPDHLSSRHIISEVQPLTEVYFDHVHKYVPMIHKPSFLKQMHSLTHPPSRFLLYAMCAVATRWSPDHIITMNNKSMPAGYAYYQRAFDLLDDFTDSPRISTVQALILLVKYQEYFQRQGFFHRSYFYLGMAVQMAIDLGLPQQIECEGHDAETRKRTFWVTFMYDLLSSIEQGHATSFTVQHCKTGFPLVTGEEGPALEELVTNQNILIQLGKVLSDIHVMSRSIATRQRTQGDKRTQEQTIEEQARLFSLHTHLENFLYEVPPTLIYPPTQDTDSYPAEVQLIGDPFIGFLHMTYHFSVILLHRIYTSLSPPKTEYNFIAYPHRRLCAASASNITMIVKTLIELYPIYTFHYPTRGVQHTIHCLATASTIHKYEMRHAPDELSRDAANDQYILTLELMQQLAQESPSTQVAALFPSGSGFLQDSTIASMATDPTHLANFLPYYDDTPPPQYAESLISKPYTSRIRRHTVSSQEFYTPDLMLPQQVIRKQQSFDPSTLNMEIMLVPEEDAIMMDSHHYDPTPGMSQLFLTEGQQQLWGDSTLVPTTEARSEGHVMK